MFHNDSKSLETMDIEVFNLTNKELERQELGLELIASENYASQAVMQAQGSILTNKYAEGLPHKRYYGGCEHVDTIEQLAIDRVKELFKCEYANVQPHSGSQANMGAYFAIIEPGDKVMGMDLSQGGHLTHGSPVNFSGRLFDIVSYGLNIETESLDYDMIREIAIKEKPKLIVAGASAYAREIDFKKFREIADEVGAYLMVDMAHIAGLVAAGLHQSPVPYADVVTTTTHKTVRGPRGGAILCKDKYKKAISKVMKLSPKPVDGKATNPTDLNYLTPLWYWEKAPFVSPFKAQLLKSLTKDFLVYLAQESTTTFEQIRQAMSTWAKASGLDYDLKCYLSLPDQAMALAADFPLKEKTQFSINANFPLNEASLFAPEEKFGKSSWTDHKA